MGRDDGGDSAPVTVEDGLYYPLDYVIDTWYQNDRHGTFPAPGGYDMQDPLLMADWRKLNLLYNQAYALASDEKDGERDGTGNILADILADAPAGDLTSLFHD